METAVGWLRAYVMPLVVLLGLLGNVTTMAIFLQENAGRRWTRFGVYGIAVATSDTLALVFNTFLDDFLGRGLWHASRGKFLIKIDTKSGATCKLMEYIPNVVYFTSSYLLIMFTMDRTLMIFRPLQFMSHLHVKTTLALIFATFASGLCLMMPMAFIYDVRMQNDTSIEKKCQLLTHSRMYKTLSRVMLYFMTFGSFVLPSVVVCLLSVVIVVKLSIIRRNRASILPTAADNQMEMSRFYAHLALAITYCVLVLPLAVSICMRQVFENKPEEYRKRFPHYAEFLAHLSRFNSSVKDFNYALNFWVYLLFVRSFRRRCLVVVSQLLVALRCTTACGRVACCRQAEDRVRRLRQRKDKSIKQALYQHRSRLVSRQDPTLVRLSSERGADCPFSIDCTVTSV